MKPFNLKEALSGALVVTRNGCSVSQLNLFEIDALYPLYAVVEGVVYNYNIKGEFKQFDESCLDLFMAESEEEKVQWINVWENLYGVIFCTNWSREDKADLEIENELNFKHLKKIKITL